MIDFHSHILPCMDDGADSIETSLAMLRESKRQGVDLICSTSHFYADEDGSAVFFFPPMLLTEPGFDVPVFRFTPAELKALL